MSSTDPESDPNRASSGILGPGHTYASVTDKISAIVLVRPYTWHWFLGMGIGYTAMLTAFYVDNGPHLPLWDRLPKLAFWLLPSAVAAPIIARAVIHARRASPTPADQQIPGASSADTPSRAAGTSQERAAGTAPASVAALSRASSQSPTPGR